MANHKSSTKRAHQNLKRGQHNKQIKSKIRTFEKKLLAAISSGDKPEASQLFLTFNSAIDKAAQKGIYHANNAARKISRLSQKVQKIKI